MMLLPPYSVGWASRAVSSMHVNPLFLPDVGPAPVCFGEHAMHCYDI